jgi:hypothetical protein
VDYNFFAAWRLCEKKKRKNKARKAGKAQSQSAAAESHTERPQFLCGLSVDRQALRLPTVGRSLREVKT